MSSRMLPAIAAWVAAKRQPGVLSIEGNKFDLLDVVGSALANGTNPDHKDYWLPASKDDQDQRQVESSLIAWSLWLLRDTLLPQMSSADRRRLDEWLASCTVVPVRANNWAWFTAVNTAARMVLKDKFDEFSFNQSEMFEDLKALNGMHAGNGWYNDAKPGQSYDYYNSWVFASHFLYWNAMVGERFPDWSKLFGRPAAAIPGDCAALLRFKWFAHSIRPLIDLPLGCADAIGACARPETMAARCRNVAPDCTRQFRVPLQEWRIRPREGQTARDLLGQGDGRHTRVLHRWRTSVLGHAGLRDVVDSP